MKRIILLLSAITVFSCKESTRATKHEISQRDKDIQEIVSMLVSEKIKEQKKVLVLDKLHPVNHFLYDRDLEISPNEFLDSEDITYIRQQSKDTVRYSIGDVKVKDAILIPADSIDELFKSSINDGGTQLFWKEVYKKYGDGFSTIGKPLFSKDSRTVVVIVGSSCGPMCGGGYLTILQKKEKGWVIVNTRLMWIS